MNDEKFNVPGSIEYKDTEPIDSVLRAHTDLELRGYWLARAADGQICFVSNNNDADHVTLALDVDGTPIIKYSSQSTEFNYDGVHAVRVKRYS